MLFYAKITSLCLSGLLGYTLVHDFYHLSQKKVLYQKTIAEHANKVATNPFLLKFTSLNHEINLPQLEIKGTIPTWLTGTLIRNGIGKFETDKEVVTHAFDGFAMLHAFSFSNGTVSYANQFLKSNYYKQAMKTGTITNGFANDPCKLIFSRLCSYFSPSKIEHDNANVNITKIADHFVALTETPLAIEFDFKTLNTVGPLPFNDKLKGHYTTAHPHIDSITGEMFNHMTHFARESRYNIYSIQKNSTIRKLLASVPVDKPSYMHSFSLTKNYVILTEIPFRVNPLSLIFMTKSFIKNFVWEPEKNTLFTVVDRRDGTIVGRFAGEPFFTFHHVNAFEEDGNIIIDLITYDDPTLIDGTTLNHIFNAPNKPTRNNLLKRFTINLKQQSVDSTVLSSTPIEMPQINYEKFNMMPYKYVYALGSLDYHKNHSSLIKTDVTNGSIHEWNEKNCSMGEPIFVAAPHAHDEDEGVILSIVLDYNAKRSFLLILDAKTFKEIGRALVPHHIPLSLHGAFFKN